MAGEATVSRVRLIDFDEVTPGQFFRAYAGKSTDEKPGDDDEKKIYQRTGNIFIEIDTGYVYWYDEETEGWIRPGESAGGES